MRITVVTPTVGDTHNGNWQTAHRYARLLAPLHKVDLRAQWRPGDRSGDLLIALHARKSAASIAAWPRDKPVLLVLTGTDLYRDIVQSPEAQASLARADALVVLNRLGAEALPAPLRAKCQVILQSCVARKPLPKPKRHLRALVVGHLRAEKDPLTLFAAVRLLKDRPDIRIDHLGAALDPALGREAEALMRDCPAYRWLGNRPHGEARRRMASAHLLVHMSLLEGGAHVLSEALRAGTPVLASRIAGNLGLLGEDWPLTFAPGDAEGLAAALQALRAQPERQAAFEALARARSADFSPERERAGLLTLVDTLLPKLGAPMSEGDGA